MPDYTKKSPAPTQTSQPAQQTNKTGWVFPVNSQKFTQFFGGMHKGLDIGIPIGTPIVAPTNAKVIRAGPDNTGYGNLVVLETADGLQVFLGHLNNFAVRVGDTVKAGGLLGYSGNTGNSTGPHLHYEIRQGTGRIDPLKIPYLGSSTVASQQKSEKSYKPSEKPSTLQSMYVKATKTGSIPERVVNTALYPIRASQAVAQNTAENIADNPWGKLANVKWVNVGVFIIGLVLMGIGAIAISKPVIDDQVDRLIKVTETVAKVAKPV